MFPFFRKKQRPSHAPRRNYRPQLEAFEDRLVPTTGLFSGFTLVNLASDVPGQYAQYDPNLMYPQSIAVSSSGQAATIWSYIVETISGDGLSAPSTISGFIYPTGVAYNGTSGFAIGSNGSSAPSEYLFGSILGVIEGYSPLVNSGQPVVAIDRSSQAAGYNRLAVGTDSSGHSFLYVNDNGYPAGVRVFDQNFNPVSTAPNALRDPNYLGSSANQYAEGLQVAGDHVFVTFVFIAYDLQQGNPDGPFVVDEFDLDGMFVKSIPIPPDSFDFPTAIAIAPADFPSYGGDLLVADYNTGFVDAYSIDTGAFLGSLTDANGVPIVAPQVRTLTFGPNLAQGSGDALYFDSSDEGFLITFNGIFGVIEVPADSACTSDAVVLAAGDATDGLDVAANDPTARADAGSADLPAGPRPRAGRAAVSRGRNLGAEFLAARRGAGPRLDRELRRFDAGGQRSRRAGAGRRSAAVDDGYCGARNADAVADGSAADDAGRRQPERADREQADAERDSGAIDVANGETDRCA